jgi:hypothetical protein
MTRAQEDDSSGSNWKRSVREALRPDAHPNPIVENLRRD